MLFCWLKNNIFQVYINKGVYPYEYMDCWEKFDENTLPPKEAFSSNINLEDISDEDYMYAQKVWDAFEINNIGDYHDLYAQSDTLLLADVYDDFRNMCFEKYQLDLTYFLYFFCLEKKGVKLELITDYDMILMIEKGIRGRICQATHRYAKANNKYIKNYDKNIESFYIEYLDANSLYGLAMSQKLPVNGFEWVKQKKVSKFNEDFIKNYDENSNKVYFLKVDIDYPKEVFNLHKDLPFLPKRKKVEKVEKLICSIENKEKYVIHIRSCSTSIKSWVKIKKGA